jgi:prepilin signal peptidase PulO-like enzyme (type II secretory pathway)
LGQVKLNWPVAHLNGKEFRQLQALTAHTLPVDLAVGMAGLFVGSLLNFVALKSLSEESLMTPRSYCSSCHHKLRLSELVPVASYVLQKGRCAHCGARLSWHYPVVEILTAAFFLTLVRTFGLTPYAFGMMVFVSTLIAVTITDFKEKLIPHEITYPAIIAGIIFSIVCRHDTLGTLAGIGASYILFDFLAFYGLKFYLHFNKPEWYLGGKRSKALAADAPPAKQAVKEWPRAGKTFFSLEPVALHLKRVDEKIRQGIQVLSNGQPVQEIEVMGGGDAVLSALIAAWLGLPRLINALLIGFLIGTFMGAMYLMVELYRQRLLSKLVRPISLGVGFGVILMVSFLALIAWMLRQPYQSMPWVPFIVVGCLGGLLIGVLSSGLRVSKPFPFGPALAGGAAIALFTNPKNNLGVGGT